MGGTHWMERFSPSRLRELRKQRGYTQIEFAARVGQVQAAYSRYENAKQKPTAATLLKFAGALDVDIDDLLDPGPVDMALLRARRGLTQAETAKRLGVSLRWYGQIEAGAAPVSHDLLQRLSRLLDVRPADLSRLLKVADED